MAKTSARERNERMAAGDFGTGSNTNKYLPQVQPDSSYGVFGNTYASTLPTADPVLGGFNDIALRNRADQERDDYLAQMEAARKYGLVLQRNDIGADLDKTIIQNSGEMYAGEAAPGMRSDGTYGVLYDPVVQMTRRGQQINTVEAEKRETNANANKQNYEAGIMVDPAIAATRDQGYLDTTPAKPYGVFAGGVNPGDQAAQAQAAAAQLSAEARMLDAQQAPTIASINASGRASEPTITVTQGAFGMPPTVQIKGKGAGMQQYMTGTGPAALGGGNTQGGGEPPQVQRARRLGYGVKQVGGGWEVTAPNGATRVYQ